MFQDTIHRPSNDAPSLIGPSLNPGSAAWADDDHGSPDLPAELQTLYLGARALDSYSSQHGEASTREAASPKAYVMLLLLWRPCDAGAKRANLELTPARADRRTTQDGIRVRCWRRESLIAADWGLR